MCICVCVALLVNTVNLFDPKHIVGTTVTPGNMADHSSKAREDVRTYIHTWIEADMEIPVLSA